MANGHRRMTRLERPIWVGLVYTTIGIIVATIAFAVYCITQ